MEITSSDEILFIIISLLNFSDRSMSQLIDNSGIEEDEDEVNEANMIQNLEGNPAISIISKSSSFQNHSSECTTACEDDDKHEESAEGTTGFNWNQLSANLTNKNNEASKENDEQSEHGDDNNIENAGSIPFAKLD